MGSFYVTTPIYYVNGAPHLGHAYTTVVADALARYHRMRGDDVFFMTGTDEHGLKVQREAEAQGLTPKELADQNSAKFKDVFDQWELTYDRFIRTTDQDHKHVVESIYQRMLNKGDIYLDTYSGWYAAADEAYYDESEIEDGKSIATGAEVEWVEEESYFFRLSKYQDKLEAWYKDKPEGVRPDARYKEVTSFVSGGLKDLSISRTTFDWGIPLPNDPKHVLYVWVDALTNYITGVGAFGQDDEAWEKFWPCDLHLLGKDILRFHCVYWPAFLMSAEIPVPKQLFVHGWWLVEGQKMSKREGNWIDPVALAKEFPLDLLRYYLLREVPLGNDGNFVKARLIERNNAELADNFGNLVNRTIKMLGRFSEGKLATDTTVTDDDKELVGLATQTWQNVEAAVAAKEIHRALELTLSFSTELNQYIQRNQPWKLAKSEDAASKTRLGQVLYHALEGIRWVALLLRPFVPKAANLVLDAFGISTEDRTFATLNWGGLQAGGAVSDTEVLFTKLELPKEESDEDTKPPKGKQEKKQKKAKKDDTQGTGLIGFDAFLAVEMRVGKVVEATRVEGADKLLKLTVNVGEPEPRTIVAGIAKAYAPEDLVGNHYAVVSNLKPAKLFGILSQGMMLAVDTLDGQLELATFSQNVAPGTRIS